MQAKASEKDVEALLCEFETTSNRSWLNHELFTSWLVVEPQVKKVLYRPKRDIYYGALLPSVKLTKLERPSLHPNDF